MGDFHGAPLQRRDRALGRTLVLPVPGERSRLPVTGGGLPGQAAPEDREAMETTNG